MEQPVVNIHLLELKKHPGNISMEMMLKIDRVKMILIFAVIISLAEITAWCGPANQVSPVLPAEHVLIVGLDGCRPDLLRYHAGTNINRLIKEGSVCWHAQADVPSVTQVNWSSILTGCSPDVHGIDKAQVTEDELAAMKLKVPTVFEMIAENGGTAVGLLGHWKLYPLERNAPTGTHFEHSPYQSTEAAAVAAHYIEHDQPPLLFVYMGDLDGLGHRYGWMSDEQIRRMTKIDAAIGQLLDALEKAGTLEKTVVMVVSDHGGHQKSHSQGTTEDVTVPWIIFGPGVQHGYEITQPVSNHQTAPTVLQALGLTAPKAWNGRPVQEGFATLHAAGSKVIE
jgi:predicted AlkP superfamily pyrophosphatase or phosphodiesterase